MNYKYYNVSSLQLTIMSLLICILTISLFEINSLIKEYISLPEVMISTKDNLCIKVINHENGQAYNCNDVNIILRKYRKIIVTE